MTMLLTSREVDELLRYPHGRALRLAKAGKLPHIILPDGEIRFDQGIIFSLLDRSRSGDLPGLAAEVAHG